MYKILNVMKDTDFVEQTFEDNLLIENYDFKTIHISFSIL